MAQRPLTIVRNALFAQFSGLWDSAAKARQAIKDATYKGSEDPGGWAPTAAVVIHTESGIPSPLYDAMTLWDTVNDDLMDAGMHYEPHNGAIVSVWVD